MIYIICVFAAGLLSREQRPVDPWLRQRKEMTLERVMAPNTVRDGGMRDCEIGYVDDDRVHRVL